MKMDFIVHGYWIIGAIFMTFGCLILGNIEWVEGTTKASFIISLVLAFLLILIGGLFWISSAINAKELVK